MAARAAVHAALGDPAWPAVVDMLRLGDASPGDVAQSLDLPTNLVAHHLKVLEGAGVVARSRSQAVPRRTGLRVVPRALAGLLTPPRCRIDRLAPALTPESEPASRP